MRNKTRTITVTALFTALSVAFIYFASLIPTGQLGFLGAASLFGIAAVIECGLGGGIAVFIGTSVLSFLLVPDKMVLAVYALFFGYYPIIKSFAERCKSLILEWAVKLISVNIALAVIFFVVSATIFDLTKLNNSYVLAFILCNAAFVVFDFGVSRLIVFYISKISHKRKH